MKMSLTFTKTRVLTHSIRRDVEVPDHIVEKGEEFAMVWATHNAIPTTAIPKSEGGDGWTECPEPPPVVVCIDIRTS